MKIITCSNTLGCLFVSFAIIVGMFGLPVAILKSGPHDYIMSVGSIFLIFWGLSRITIDTHEKRSD